MFEVKKSLFHCDDYGDDDYLDNWPMLYLLEGNKKMYVGQSNRINLRMKEHKDDLAKEFSQIVHLIYSKEFNLSATLDYESKLIQYIFADHKYIITNGNRGIVNREYY